MKMIYILVILSFFKVHSTSHNNYTASKNASLQKSQKSKIYKVKLSNHTPNHKRSKRIHKHLGDRIIGGSQAEIWNYPFMASLVKKYSFSYIEFRGGATIISTHWVVTAAHCMAYFELEEIEAGIGYVRSNTSQWENNYEEHTIDEFHIHEKFNLEIIDYDIAVVKVRQPFKGKYEKPIQISRNPYFEDESPAITLGWGSTLPDDHTMVVHHLRSVEVRIKNLKTCKDQYEKLGETVTNRMICALGHNKDACTNDSGGPLFQNDTLIGIVSWGPPTSCADPVLPGGYTRVPYLYDWILYKIRLDKRNLKMKMYTQRMKCRIRSRKQNS